MSAIRDLCHKYPGRWPSLERAAENEADVQTVRVEWLLHRPMPFGMSGSVLAFNYCEIFRAPSKEDVLDLIELAVNGDQKPDIDFFPYAHSFMGGFKGYDGPLSLRILRDLQLIGETTDWMAEVTVIAPDYGAEK